MKIMGNGHESQSMNSREQKVIKDDILNLSPTPPLMD